LAVIIFALRLSNRPNFRTECGLPSSRSHGVNLAARLWLLKNKYNNSLPDLGGHHVISGHAESVPRAVLIQLPRFSVFLRHFRYFRPSSYLT
jgi:hypothetical protein